MCLCLVPTTLLLPVYRIFSICCVCAHCLVATDLQDAVRALKARLADATAALQVSQSETLRLRTRVADLKAAVSLVRALC